MARPTSVFDAWLDHHFHHDTDNGIALIVTMTCHMAVAGQNAITVAVIDVGCGDDHTWLAEAVKKHKPRMVMGFFGKKLEAVVRTLRAHRLQVAVAGSQLGHGDGSGWVGGLAVLAVGPFDEVRPLGMPVDTPWPRHYVPTQIIRYLTECRRTDADESKGWADIQFAKQRPPARRIPHVEKVSMAMGAKKSWRKPGRTRPSVQKYRLRRAWNTNAYYMPRAMPYSRNTDVVWQHFDPWPWPAQHWGVRYPPW